MASVAPAPPWKQLPFFDVSQVKDAHDLASTPAAFKNVHEISTITTSGSGAGILLADIYGNIHVLDRDLESAQSWTAHNGGRVTHMAICKGILITIGEEEASSVPLLKIWDLEKHEKTSQAPLLLRSVKIQHGTRPHPVSTIAVSASLSHLAVGLADGTVLMYRQLDQSIFSNSTSLTNLPKPRIILESPTEPVTGLGFREPTEESPQLYLFIVTLNRVLSHLTGKGGGNSPVVVDEVGAALGCAVVDWKAKDIIVARDEAIYACGVDVRGASYALEGKLLGHKLSVHSHLNYLVIVSPPFVPTATNASATVRNFVARTALPSNTDVAKVTVFDLENKFIAHSGTFTDGVRAIISEWDQIFVLTNDGKLWRLEEKPISAKLEMLYQKSWYALALDLARNQGLEPSSVADINRRYGDQMYAKGDFDGAMRQFLKTIGHVQPSYVIRKFLDAQRIHNLVTYLQELHALGLANSDHTTLLLNTYTKLKDVSRLDNFIKTESTRSTDAEKDELPFDLDTAIRVCRQAGYFEHASYLAKKYQRHEDYLRIQVEDSGNFKDALNYLRKLDPEATESSLARYGRAMLANLPDETTRLFIDICVGASSSNESDALAVTTSKGNTGPSYLSYLTLNRGSSIRNATGDASPSTPATPTPAAAGSPSTPAKQGHERRGSTIPSHIQDPSQADSVAPSLTVKLKPEKKPSPRLYFSHFVDRMDKFLIFLEDVALRRWAQTVEDPAPTVDMSNVAPPLDEEAEKRDQVAVWNTLLELYLLLSDQDAAQAHLRDKALRLLTSETIPYDATHALILCSTRNFAPGLVLLWEKMGMYEDVLRFWMDKEKEGTDRDASTQVLLHLNMYGPKHPKLYALVLRFLTSSPELLSRHSKDLVQILDHIDANNIMPPLGVIQVLSRNKVATVGLVKQWLMNRIKESREEIDTDKQLINSYRVETSAKEKQIEELSDPSRPRVFHVTRCSQCGQPLDLPNVHFMCNHSYHQRCVPDNERECPICARDHAMIREIRRNNEQLADQHDLFLSEVKENGFNAVASAFGRGAMRTQRSADLTS